MGNEHRDLLGRDVLAEDGAKLGHVADVYVDPTTGAPKWLVVPGGLLSGGVSFIPADGAGEDEDGRVVVAYTRKQIRKAPHPDADGDLSPTEEADLARHYLAASQAAEGEDDHDGAAAYDGDPAYDPTVETDLDEVRAGAATVADADPTDEWLVASDPDADSMVRAEEELRVEAAPRPVQRARLVKRVVTEEVTFTVPVRREVLHVEYEDIAEDELVAGTMREPFAPMPEQEIVLYAEIVEYEKKIVPKERVRLQKEVVDELVDVRGEVRKEEVEVVDSPSAPNFI